MSDGSVWLLADLPHLVPAVARLRWAEWGEDLSTWVNVTGREAGRDGLPVTFVAVDPTGEAIGAVGLGNFDIDERRDRTPWVLGMIVRPASRGGGVGRVLLSTVERLAADRGYPEVWVATGQAAGFYRRCGWQEAERLRLASGEESTVLRRSL